MQKKLRRFHAIKEKLFGNNYKSLIFNWPIVDFGFLLQRDEKFIPMGVAENYQENVKVPLENQAHMKMVIEKELVSTNSVLKSTKEKIFRKIDEKQK